MLFILGRIDSCIALLFYCCIVLLPHCRCASARKTKNKRLQKNLIKKFDS